MIWLDAARVAAIVAVVLLHVSASVVTQAPLGSTVWWVGNGYDALVRWCVPVFVMVSGALLLDARKTESLATFYRKRAARIALPLLFWSVVYVLWNYRHAWDQLRPADVLHSVARGWPHYHLWFLYMLLCLYLFTPFLRIVAWHTSRRDLWWLVGALFVLAGVNEWHRVATSGGAGLFINRFLSYLPYFFCGYLLRTAHREVPLPWLVAVFAFSVTATEVGCFWVGRTHGLDKGLYFYGYLSATVIPMSLSAMLMFKRCAWEGACARRAQRLSQLTLGAYLVHPILLELLRSIVLQPEQGGVLWSVPGLALVVFAGSLGVAWMFQRMPLLNRMI